MTAMANVLAVVGVYAVATALAVLLAWPTASFLLLVFSLGLIYVVLLPIRLAALLGPAVLLIVAALAWFKRVARSALWTTLHAWLCMLIVHAGAARGMSRWGDVGSTMGAKNMSYGEAFLAPLTFFLNRAQPGMP
jgi:hypothetical protein